MIRIVLCFAIALIFSRKIMEGKPSSAAWASGFTTFLILLGSSTGGDSSASSSFYPRIAQVLFAGLFCILAIVVIKHRIHKRKVGKRWWQLGRLTAS